MRGIRSGMTTELSTVIPVSVPHCASLFSSAVSSWLACSVMSLSIVVSLTLGFAVSSNSLTSSTGVMRSRGTMRRSVSGADPRELEDHCLRSVSGVIAGAAIVGAGDTSQGIVHS